MYSKEFSEESMQKKVFISGVGIYLPNDVVTSEELVHSYNAKAHYFNLSNSDEISSGKKSALPKSDVEFIVKASGIKKRRLITKDIVHGIPCLPSRANTEMSIQCEFALHAAREALKNANKTADQVEAIIVAASNMQRPYPAIAIELQSYLGAHRAFGFDMNTACSSASFAIALGKSLIKAGEARNVLIVSPEIYSGNLNFLDRKNNFIFGDGCSAVLLEDENYNPSSQSFEIISTKLQSNFSNNIRNNFGFLNRYIQNASFSSEDQFFNQNGKMVSNDIIHIVSNHIKTHISESYLDISNIKRLWLHQANLNLIRKIGELIYEGTIDDKVVPSVIEEYGNTGAAGMMMTFHHHHADFQKGEIGILSSFGAGYAVGSIVIQKI